MHSGVRDRPHLEHRGTWRASQFLRIYSCVPANACRWSPPTCSFWGVFKSRAGLPVVLKSCCRPLRIPTSLWFTDPGLLKCSGLLPSPVSKWIMNEVCVKANGWRYKSEAPRDTGRTFLGRLHGNRCLSRPTSISEDCEDQSVSETSGQLLKIDSRSTDWDRMGTGTPSACGEALCEASFRIKTESS